MNVLASKALDKGTLMEMPEAIKKYNLLDYSCFY